MGIHAPPPTTLFGMHGDPASEAARRFLERNGVPLRWIGVDRDPIAGLLATEELSSARLPLAVFPDGSRLEGPEQWLGRRAPTPTEGGSRPADESMRRRYRESRRWQAALAAGAG